MGRDKKKDDLYYNCSQKHEENYVVGLYPALSRLAVRQFLQDKCADNTIKNSTHMEVYKLIEDKLGLPIPIEA